MSDPPSLDQLRRRLDGIDDRLHDLILERASVIESVNALKRSSGQPALRPGREAQILRRLAARHGGPFPRDSMVRLWCEILGVAVSMQGRFTVAVATIEGRPGFWDLARDYFGGQVPLTPMRGNGEIVTAVGDGRATVGILPMPKDGEREPWWPALADGRNAPRVLMRLPFAGAGNARYEDGDALVIGTVEPDPSGADCGMLAIETGDVVRARLMSALEGVGRAAYLGAHRPDANTLWHLIELDDVIEPNDARLVAALKPLGKEARTVRLLGLYPRPLPPEPA
jgi:chorismate mutase/prephenate dehydratase